MKILFLIILSMSLAGCATSQYQDRSQEKSKDTIAFSGITYWLAYTIGSMLSAPSRYNTHQSDSPFQ